MHIIAIGEGYPDALKRVENYFHGKEYANGKCKVRFREIKMYNINFNECGYEEVLADLKDLTRYNEDKNSNYQKNTTQELHAKLSKYIKYFRKFFKFLKPIEDDLDKTKSSDLRRTESIKGNHLNCVLHPLGKVNDWRKGDGSEAV